MAVSNKWGWCAAAALMVCCASLLVIAAQRNDKPEPPIVRTISLPPNSGHPVHLTGIEWLKFAGIVAGQLVALITVGLKVSIQMDRRITILEANQKTVLETLRDLRVDIKELAKRR